MHILLKKQSNKSNEGDYLKVNVIGIDCATDPKKLEYHLGIIEIAR